MYGFWYLVIAVAFLGLIGLVIMFATQDMESEAPFYMGATFCSIGIVCLLIFIPLSIVNPIQAKKEIQTFYEQKQIIEEVIDTSEDLDNVSLTQTIIEMNKWLSEAKASIKTYGCFSKYWNKDVESIEPIRRPQKE